MLRRIAFLLVFFCMLACGQSNAPDTTWGMMNGRYWEKLGTQKVTFVVGILDGTKAAYLMAALSDGPTGVKLEEAFSIQKFTFGEITKQLEVLYSDRANTLIPIAMMLTHVTKIFKGDLTKAELEKDLISLRQIYNN